MFKYFILFMMCLGVLSIGVYAAEDNAIRFKGDLRLRYQNEDKQDDGQPGRVRARLRARLGAKKKLNKEVSVYMGLASGDSNARSTNQSLDSANSTKSIGLDYAYAKFKVQGSDVFAGKMKNPLWRVSDLMWDKDIRPEGAAVKYGMGSWSILGSYFILDEDEENDYDPHMLAIQLRKKHHVKGASIQAAVTTYHFQNVKGWDPDGNLGGFSAYDHNPMVLSASAKIGFRDVLGLPYIAIFGDFLQNAEKDDNHQGALAGVVFGEKKVKKIGQWQAKVQYRHLQDNAILDIFPDADAFGGHTGVQGFELIASLGIAKNTKLSFDYYVMEDIQSSQEQRLFQTDISVIF